MTNGIKHNSIDAIQRLSLITLLCQIILILHVLIYLSVDQNIFNYLIYLLNNY